MDYQQLISAVRAVTGDEEFTFGASGWKSDGTPLAYCFSFRSSQTAEAAFARLKELDAAVVRQGVRELLVRL
ncbi:MAG: hypothetical protein HC800_20525 [Phormidesmis sp. RL_2_1]|nr:hypothetical protein [Phormidesmis sp. RL_2_1]